MSSLYDEDIASFDFILNKWIEKEVTDSVQSSINPYKNINSKNVFNFFKSKFSDFVDMHPFFPRPNPLSSVYF